MKTIRLYYHHDCRKCARLAQLDQLLDWRDRLEISTAIPKTGPLRLGEIVVEELATGHIFRGAEAFRQLCLTLPLYAPALLLLAFPPFRAWIDRTLSGCAGNSCGVNPIAFADRSEEPNP